MINIINYKMHTTESFEINITITPIFLNYISNYSDNSSGIWSS
jgi:hypothetical protein